MNNYVFLTVGGVKESKDIAGEFKKYIGIAPCQVVAVNPTLKELNDLGVNFKSEPEYVGTLDVDGKQVPSVRIDFWIKTYNTLGDGKEVLSRVSYRILKSMVKSNDGTKVKVVDEFNRDAWATKDEFQKHEIPTYSSGKKANVSENYIAEYRGYQKMVAFLRQFLSIEDVWDYDNMCEKADKQNYALTFDNIDAFFKGDVSEIKEAIALAPNNRVRVMFGVKTKEDGNTTQETFSDYVGKNGYTKFDKFAEVLNERKANGAYPTTEFEACKIKEYVAGEKASDSTSNNDEDIW